MIPGLDPKQSRIAVPSEGKNGKKLGKFKSFSIKKKEEMIKIIPII
jgi:hypothetical protein